MLEISQILIGLPYSLPIISIKWMYNLYLLHYWWGCNKQEQPWVVNKHRRKPIVLSEKQCPGGCHWILWRRSCSLPKYNYSTSQMNLWQSTIKIWANLQCWLPQIFGIIKIVFWMIHYHCADLWECNQLSPKGDKNPPGSPRRPIGRGALVNKRIDLFLKHCNGSITNPSLSNCGHTGDLDAIRSRTTSPIQVNALCRTKTGMPQIF